MPSNDNANVERGTANGNSNEAQQGQKRPRQEIESDVFILGPRRKVGKADRLVSYGRHFGRTVRTFCNLHVLIKEGVSREEQMITNSVEMEDLKEQERREHTLFRELLKVCPFLGERLFDMDRTVDDLIYAADMLTKGVNTARADDVKSLKSAVIDWITPEGGVLSPALPRNSKIGRGFHHSTTGMYLCPTDYDWEDESSVDGDTRATRSGNAQIHGMRGVTAPSVAYIATLVRFSLTSAGSFSRSDPGTDSQTFYNSLLSFLEDEDEQQQVSELLHWWNEQIFPGLTGTGTHDIPSTAAINKLKKQRRKKLAERTNRV
ncbi:hypothetical protein NMY22_g16943 [Coprinellus aureogranulatus]|nr:hypothetical protein NMY22_g16943 [Coprinellus aureogranulatus]